MYGNLASSKGNQKATNLPNQSKMKRERDMSIIIKSSISFNMPKTSNVAKLYRIHS